MDAEIWISLNL